MCSCLSRSTHSGKMGKLSPRLTDTISQIEKITRWNGKVRFWTMSQIKLKPWWWNELMRLKWHLPAYPTPLYNHRKLYENKTECAQCQLCPNAFSFFLLSIATRSIFTKKEVSIARKHRFSLCSAAMSLHCGILCKHFRKSLTQQHENCIADGFFFLQL